MAEKAEGLSVVVGVVLETKCSCDNPRAEIPRGCEWIAAYVSVSGFVKAAKDVGMMLYAHKATTLAIRRGTMISGRRMRSATNVDKHVVPSIGPVA